MPRKNKTVLIVGTLDTKGPEVACLRDYILSFGSQVLVMDVNMGGEGVFPADFPADEVARAGGASIGVIRTSQDTAKWAQVMTEGAVRIARSLHKEGRIDGIIGLGGASNTVVATGVMKALPFGFPKLMISSAASMPAYAGRFIGTKDIMMMHSVVDIAGLNFMVRDVLARAAAAMCGMIEKTVPLGPLVEVTRNSRFVAVSSFKFIETCVRTVQQRLSGLGLQCIRFHAQGIGDRAMEEMIEEGLFAAVLDLVPAGLSEYILGGNRATGPSRLQAAGRMGLPQVVAPCGFEMISCGPLERRDQGDPLWMRLGLAARPLFIPDSVRVQARTTAEELRAIARVVAGKLKLASGPVRFLIPKRGWSSISEEGQALHDPAADAAFVAELSLLSDGAFPVIEVDAPANSAEFAGCAIDHLLEMLQEEGPVHRW